MIPYCWNTPFIKRGTTTSVCQSSGNDPSVHATLQSCVIQSLSSSPTVTKDFFDHLGNFSPRSPGPALMCVGRIEEVFKVLPLQIHSVLGWGQHTIPTIHNVDCALLTLYPSQSHPEIIVYLLTKLFPRPGLCLSKDHSHTPLGLLVPVCLRSHHWPKRPNTTSQTDGIPHRRCLADQGVAAITDCLNNRITEFAWSLP